jgi:hypothetical protein
MNNDRKFTPCLPVENREQTFVGIPLDNTFSGNPVRATFATCARLTMRNIKNHGIGCRTDTADWRTTILRLHGADGGSKNRDQTEKTCANGQGVAPDDNFSAVIFQSESAECNRSRA